MALIDDASFRSEGRLYKHDLLTGMREMHGFGPKRYPGESVFVPAHAEAAADDGWVIGLVVDAAAHTTDFVIINARTFTQPPVARVRLPHRVPPGFHGN